MSPLLKLARTKLGCGYVWSLTGQWLTENLLNNLINSLDLSHYVKPDVYDAHIWIGHQCFDCAGFVQWCLMQLGVKLQYDDYNAAMLFDICAPIQRGELQPGDLVFEKVANGDIVHIGIYQGDGKTIEAKGTAYGVVEDVVDGRFNLFGRLKVQISTDCTDYVETIKSSLSSPDKWLEAIDFAVKMASTGKWGKCNIFRYFPDLVVKLRNANGEPCSDYIEILKISRLGSPQEWIDGIDAAIAAAKAEGNTGVLEIFEYLPTMLVKIYNS